MILVLSRFPPGIGGMAILAAGGEADGGMVWIGGGIVIGLVTRKTIGRGAGIVRGLVAVLAVAHRMAGGQWEKTMVDPGTGPRNSGDLVAFETVFGIIRRDMVWVGSCVIILLVTIDAFNAKRTKQQEICRCIFMAGIAIGRTVRTDQREPASLVDLGDVVDDPGSRCVAPFAIHADRLVVDVGMTGDAFLPCHGKLQ